MSPSLDDYIEGMEERLTRYKAVKAAFPNAKVTRWNVFSDKSVNQIYTDVQFMERHGGLYVYPFCLMDFEYKGKTQKVKIHSAPRGNKLVYLHYDYQKKKKIMSFSRLTINLKNNNFKKDMLNECRSEILKFIASHPGYELDEKHLEPRLKKLMIFT